LIYEEKAPRHALCRFATHVETRSAPEIGWCSVAGTPADQAGAVGKYSLPAGFQGRRLAPAALVLAKQALARLRLSLMPLSTSPG